jgi:hypothetical protein
MRDAVDRREPDRPGSQPILSDEALRAARRADEALQQRLEGARREMREAQHDEERPAVTAEELPDFLRGSS